MFFKRHIQIPTPQIGDLVNIEAVQGQYTGQVLQSPDGLGCVPWPERYVGRIVRRGSDRLSVTIETDEGERINGRLVY